MGKTREYLDYLNNEVGITPAASQEELDLAQSLALEYAKHGLKADVEEFPAQSLSTVPYGVAMVLLFFGAILVGFGSTALVFAGFVLLALSIGLLAATYFGNDVLSKLGPRAHSQNVVAMRPADGDGNDRNRPIVILAHYDTPRIDPLLNSQLSIVKKYLPAIVPNAIIVVALCALIQLLTFLPEAARRTFWIIGLIAALPVLVWGITLIARRFMPYADGAVGNKSSVAALLTVMDYVCEGDTSLVKSDENTKEAPERPRTRIVKREEVEETIGNRHGEAKLRELGILPESCEITYIDPEVRTVEVEEPIEYEDEQETQLTAEAENKAEAEDKSAAEPVPAAENEPAAEPASVAEFAPAVAPRRYSSSSVLPEDLQEELAANGVFDDSDSTQAMDMASELRIDTDGAFDYAGLSQLEDGQSTDEGALIETDHSGLSTMVDEDAETASAAERPKRVLPSAVDDPNWGKSSYTPAAHPAASSVARRAALFDLPNIDASNDGLNDEDYGESDSGAGNSYGMPATGGATIIQMPARSDMAQRLAEASQNMASTPTPVRLDDDASTFAANITPADAVTPMNPVAVSKAKPKRRGFAGLFGRKRKQQQESMSDWLGVEDDFDAKKSGENIGSWDNFDDDDTSGGSSWKGGAVRSINLRGGALSGLPSFDDEPEANTAGETVLMPTQDAYDAGDEVASDESGLFAAVENDGSEQEAVFDDDVNEEPAGEETESSEFEEEVSEFDDLGPDSMPIDRELRDAILAMDNEELKKHDIWFVATGGSELVHAGINEFVAGHRKNLRGSFIINLESIGAGNLTLLTYEGFGRTRRADRRLVKILNSAASDMHLNLNQTKLTWTDTEATPCMRRSLRAVTIMGMDHNEFPALSATEKDAPERVNEQQVLDVVAMITEAIKRS